MASMLVACSSSANLKGDVNHSDETRAANEEKQIEQLRAEQAQAVSLDKLSYQMLSLEGSNRIDITPESPIVQFPDGKAYVAALFIPEQINRFKFVLESEAEKTVLVPSVLMLDEKMQQVAQLGDASFDAKGYFILEETFEANIADSIRYIIVYSKEKDLSGTTEVVNVAREYEIAKGNAVSDVAFPRLYAKHSPFGRVNIRLEDIFYSAKAIQNKARVQSPKPPSTVTPSAIEKPTILSDTEAFYLQQISKAVAQGDDVRAKNLVEEAERAGSVKVRTFYLEERLKLK